jgi:restriction endonuclease S subunit
LNESRLKQLEMAEKIDDQNALIEVNEAKDKKRKAEIKKLVENRKQ